MREHDYQALYRLFHSFTTCNKKATHRVGDESEVTECPGNHLCYETEGALLYLCGTCLEFWQECQRLRDRSTWEMAVFLRESRVERQGRE